MSNGVNDICFGQSLELTRLDCSQVRQWPLLEIQWSIRFPLQDEGLMRANCRDDLSLAGCQSPLLFERQGDSVPEGWIEYEHAPLPMRIWIQERPGNLIRFRSYSVL